MSIVIKTEPKRNSTGWASICEMLLTTGSKVGIELNTKEYKIHSLTQETLDSIKTILEGKDFGKFREQSQYYYDNKCNNNNINVDYFYYGPISEKYIIVLEEKNK